MKIIQRHEFLTLPAGTVYAKYESFGNLQELCIKQESLEDDWFYIPLVSVESNSSEAFADIITEAETSSSFEFQSDSSCVNRDGLFKKGDQFVVFSRGDVVLMVEALSGAIERMTGKDLRVF